MSNLAIGSVIIGNIALIVTMVIFLFGVFNGLRKGLIRSIFSTFILVAALAIAAYSGPYAAKFLRNTSVYVKTYDKVETMVAQSLQTKIDTQVGEQVESINQMPLPDSIKKGMLDYNNAMVYDALGIDSFAAYVADYMSMIVINALAYVGIFIVAYIILKIICIAMDQIASLPVLNSINRLGGFIFGIANGIMGVWLFYIIATAFATTKWGQLIIAQIGKSTIMSVIYNHNYIVNIIKNISHIIL